MNKSRRATGGLMIFTNLFRIKACGEICAAAIVLIIALSVASRDVIAGLGYSGAPLLRYDQYGGVAIPDGWEPFSLDSGSLFVTLRGSLFLPGISWFPSSPAGLHSFTNTYTFQQGFLRLGTGYWDSSGVVVYGEAQGDTLLNLPTNATAIYPQGEAGLGATYYTDSVHRPNGAALFLKQGYFMLDPDEFNGFGIKGGRFEFDDGSEFIPPDPELAWLELHRIQQRLIGSRYVLVGGRSFDGAVLRAGDETWSVTAMASIPTEGAYLLNAMDELRDVYVGYLALNVGPQAFSSSWWSESLGRLFLVYYYDGRNVPKPDNRPLSERESDHEPISIYTLGGDLVRIFPIGPGNLDILLWWAGQLGSWGELAQRAYAYSAEVGYRFSLFPWSPWLRAGYTLASGDNNPNNSVHGTFVPVLPTPWYFAEQGFYTLMNIQDAMLQLVLDPTEQIELRSELHGLWLASSHDLWYAGGGAWRSDEVFGYVGRPSGGHSYLATVIQQDLRWQFSHNLALILHWGEAFGGSVVAAVYPRGQNSTYAFLLVQDTFF